MKKLLLLFLLSASFSGKSQEVSPFYPAKYVGEQRFGFTSQMTYFDLNFISINVSEFLTYLNTKEKLGFLPGWLSARNSQKKRFLFRS